MYLKMNTHASKYNNKKIFGICAIYYFDVGNNYHKNNQVMLSPAVYMAKKGTSSCKGDYRRGDTH
jgi:hypothetical protein